MSIKVLSQVMRDPTYDGKQKLILLAIADAVDNNGVGFTSYRQIKQVTQVTDEYLRRVIRIFIEQGRLEILRKGTGPGMATVYRVILPNSVEENLVAESYELPNCDNVNSPTATTSTPQLRQRQLPNSAPYSSLQTSSLQTSPIQAPSVVGANAPTGFEQFWSVYPRRQGKGAARTAWLRACKKSQPQHIIAAAAQYRDDANREEDFTALPATWLNQERWDDDPLPARRGQPTRNEERKRELLTHLQQMENLDARDQRLEVTA